MGEYTADEVRTLLARHGLASDVFDSEEIAADLEERTALNGTLDDLVDLPKRPDPTAFDPRWLE